MTKDRICVGAIAGAFGVHGEVRLKSFCVEPEAIFAYSPLTDEKGETEYTPKITRVLKNGFAARLSGIHGREQAEALKGLRLYTYRDRLPALPDDEFYHADLIGLDVLDTGGTLLGKVTAVLNHGAGDLLEVRAPNTDDATLLLPFTQEIVPVLDLGAGRLIADPPEDFAD
ncbi:MAG: ribosome maturation factor RimM [Pseudomonadota bacterium]